MAALDIQNVDTDMIIPKVMRGRGREGGAEKERRGEKEKRRKRGQGHPQGSARERDGERENE